MRTEIKKYYDDKGIVPPKLNIFQLLYKKSIEKRIDRIDIGSEGWMELQYYLANKSSSTFDCNLREYFYKKSCFACGSDLCIMPYTTMSYTKNIFLGDNVYINSHCIITAKAPIRIGNNALIAPNVIINSGMHNYKNADVPIKSQGHTSAPIVIEDDVWIGANCVIMKGVTLGKGCVIGANSFVNKSVAPYVVVAGSPIKVIAKRT